MLLPRGCRLLVAAQFFSALADNALLIVAIAQLVALDYPGWWAPLLKFCFTIAYVVLAPFVGVLADSVRKPRLMMAMNAVKAVGVLMLLQQSHPLLALGVIGIGAAAYAPAKYGLVTELVGPRLLVAANGWIEVTTVCAVLLGTALGGALVSPAFSRWAAQAWPGDDAIRLALWLTLAIYGLAASLNLGIRDSGVRYPRGRVHPVALTRDFVAAHRQLWRDAEGGLSMAVTTLFWGVAAVLQFAVLRWAIDVLDLTLDRAAYLQAAVAVGIVAGASLAGRMVALSRATRVLPLGIALGLVVPVVGLVDHWMLAVPLLLLVGALGGALVVPLNALLQYRGHQLLTAGRSIAVQNFNENASVLAMLGAYAALLAGGVEIRQLMSALGLLVASAVSVLWLHERRRLRALPA